MPDIISKVPQWISHPLLGKQDWDSSDLLLTRLSSIRILLKTWNNN
jgi:hypothetical protein